jgi:hypothetical protein
MTRHTIPAAIMLLLPACATITPPERPALQGVLVDSAEYARDLRGHYERALVACQGTTSTAGSGAFAWSGWVAQDGSLTDSAVDLAATDSPNPLARCVSEKLKRTKMPIPAMPAPFTTGFPASFSWAPPSTQRKDQP